MMLRAAGRYRDASRGLFYEPGEVIVVEPDEAERLERDSPGTFEVVGEAAGASLDGPPADKMVRRERAARKDRGGGEVMSRANAPGLVRG